VMKLKPSADNNDVSKQSVKVEWEYADRHGKRFQNHQQISLPSAPGFSSALAQKAVLVTRYAVFIKHLLTDAQKNNGFPTMSKERGIFCDHKLNTDQEEEKKKMKGNRAALHESYKPLTDRFADWFAQQCEKADDATLTDLQKSLEEIRTKGFEAPASATPQRQQNPQHPRVMPMM